MGMKIMDLASRSYLTRSTKMAKSRPKPTVPAVNTTNQSRLFLKARSMVWDVNTYL